MRRLLSTLRFHHARLLAAAAELPAPGHRAPPPGWGERRAAAAAWVLGSGRSMAQCGGGAAPPPSPEEAQGSGAAAGDPPPRAGESLEHDGLENVQQKNIIPKKKKKKRTKIRKGSQTPPDSMDYLMAEIPFASTDTGDEFGITSTFEIYFKKRRKRTTRRKTEEDDQTKKKKQDQPNYFISLPITNPEVVFFSILFFYGQNYFNRNYKRYSGCPRYSCTKGSQTFPSNDSLWLLTCHAVSDAFIQ
ncbi:uncharacterized protein LOC135982349 isoform X1 [Chrysemys picta bellii]|uniref:uncharacterized protein LOC135982349 isoform X1 n=1 Tax=Chrysemys picta bellii TaxID=8478 RepID=UPI0032B1DCBD